MATPVIKVVIVARDTKTLVGFTDNSWSSKLVARSEFNPRRYFFFKLKWRRHVDLYKHGPATIVKSGSNC